MSRFIRVKNRTNLANLCAGGSDDGLWSPDDCSPVPPGVDDWNLHRYNYRPLSQQQSSPNSTKGLEVNQSPISSHRNNFAYTKTCDDIGIPNRIFDNRSKSSSLPTYCRADSISETDYLNLNSAAANTQYSSKDSQYRLEIQDDTKSVPIHSPGNSALSKGEFSGPEMYDNITENSREYTTAYDNELQIIELDDDMENSVDTMKENSKKHSNLGDFQKPRGFLGRRCRSFNTFRSFFSSKASQLKRNNGVRSSFSSRSSAKTYDDDISRMLRSEPVKSIVKRPLSECLEERKKKCISFKDTVDVYPIKSQDISLDAKAHEYSSYILERQILPLRKTPSEEKMLSVSHPSIETPLQTLSKPDLILTTESRNSSDNLQYYQPEIPSAPEILQTSHSVGSYLVESRPVGIKPILSGIETATDKTKVLHEETGRYTDLTPTNDTVNEYRQVIRELNSKVSERSQSSINNQKVAALKSQENNPTDDSRALLQALEDDLEVILLKLAADENNIET